MAFHHRKLLDDSVCDQLFCDTSKNPNGTCPTFCWTICDYGVCKELLTLPPLPQPSPPPPPPPSLLFPPPGVSANQSSPTFSKALTVFLAVLAAAFFLFTCYTIYKFYTVWSSSRRRRPPPHHEEDNDNDDDDFFDPEDHGPVVDHPIWYIRTIGLQPSVINSIAIVSYKRADGVVDGTDCAVCLSGFEEDETLRLLPKCNHAFHIPCIDTWLRSHTNCPLCRAGIVISAAVPPPSAAAAAADLDSGRVEVSSIEREVEEESRSQRMVEIEEKIEEDDGKAGIQGVRRSVSMDSVSASMITAAVANAFPQQFGKNSDNDLVKEKEIVSRVGTNQQTGSSSIKRSASCSAKVFLSRHSSSRSRS